MHDIAIGIPHRHKRQRNLVGTQGTGKPSDHILHARLFQIEMSYRDSSFSLAKLCCVTDILARREVDEFHSHQSIDIFAVRIHDFMSI